MFTCTTWQPVKFTPTEKIEYELGLLDKISHGDWRAAVLYYREKLADICRCDRTSAALGYVPQETPTEIATNLLNMREFPDHNLLRQINEHTAALAAARAEIIDLREELCGAEETCQAAQALINQAELTADAIEASEDGAGPDADRLAYLEQGELVDAVALYREQRESWHDQADDDDSADDDSADDDSADDDSADDDSADEVGPLASV